MKQPSLVLCAFLFLTAVAPLRAEDTAAILARMDTFATTFHAMSADIVMTTYTKIIDDKAVDTGTLQMQHPPGQKIRALLNLTGESDSHSVFFADDTVEIYTPKAKLLKQYSAAKSSDLVEQFLLLGFGSSGKDLTQNYEVSNAGAEQINGMDTTHLSLVPKNPKVKEKLSKIEVWIPTGKAYPVQQQFFEPNGNYRITTYSALRFDPPTRKLELKVPAGTQRQ